MPDRTNRDPEAMETDADEDRLLDDEDPEGGVWQMLDQRERWLLIGACSGVALIMLGVYLIGRFWI